METYKNNKGEYDKDNMEILWRSTGQYEDYIMMIKYMKYYKCNIGMWCLKMDKYNKINRQQQLMECK